MRRRTEWVVMIAGVWISFQVVGCRVSEKQSNTPPPSASTPQTPVTKSPDQSKTASAQNQPETSQVHFTELLTYYSVGKTWKTVMIPANTKKEDPIALAKELHRKDPAGFYHFFDDDRQIKKFVDSDVHYPDPKYPSPEAWLRKHHIAMINKMLARGGATWQLVAMEAGLHLSATPDTNIIVDLE